jgi:methyltransferase (TIGR00027 family)
VSVIEPRPSRTSQVVAVTRAEFARPHSPAGDPDAQRRLCQGMSPAWVGRLYPHLEARTRFFDDQVLAAVARGIGQVVILGAGYDDRALRFRTPGVHFFELDHPGTQADKRLRLEAIPDGLVGVTLAPIEFRTDDVGQVLAGCGHDATRPSLFICEGVLVYLDQPTTVTLLAGARSRAAGGSTLAVTLAVHAAGMDSAKVVAAANARRRASAAEPWQTILPAAAQVELLSWAGWSLDEAIDDATMGTGATPEHSLSVTARPGPAAGGPPAAPPLPRHRRPAVPTIAGHQQQ